MCRIVFAQCYFHARLHLQSTLSSFIFAQTWFSFCSRMIKKEYFAQLKTVPLTMRAKGVKIKQGQSFPSIQYSLQSTLNTECVNHAVVGTVHHLLFEELLFVDLSQTELALLLVQDDPLLVLELILLGFHLPLHVIVRTVLDSLLNDGLQAFCGLLSDNRR